MAKTILFESPITELVLVRQCKAQIPIPDGTGWQTTRKTVEYKFHPENSARGEDRRIERDRAHTAEFGWVGVLRVKEGQDKLKTDGEGWLRDGEEVGVERDAVAALMAHKSFGQRFWLVGHAPGTLYPRPEDFRRDVTLATANLADDKLADMIAEEKRTHGRADLISEAENALGVVTEIIATEQAKREADEAKAAKAKPKAAAPA